MTSFSIIADITKNIAGDLITIETLVKAGSDIHSYQITSSDIVKLQDSDLILYNGLSLEAHLMKYFKNLRKRIAVVAVTDGIKPINISDNKNPNPHAWMSPNNAMIYIENIRKALETLDPQHADEYTQNAKAYSEKIRNMISPLRSEFLKLDPSKRWLVTSEGCFPYVANDFGLKTLYLWEINSDSDRTPSQIRHVIDQVRKHKIKFIFSESTNSDQPAKQLAAETGALYGGILYVDSLSELDGPIPTYMDLLRVTFTTIIRHISS
ncbi:metal ABC transporter solute-binding protein, Zn/Mn family [Candidatus Liberibacter sp.]|uniref:metal ABC transporter solute-binding protein, Zn/Mn family n=1 Tax=Candidatus Liberibacter sp. TaxID=34022 RepID=UPI0015F6F913|nr:zinc ABC transporter substrate-binding protein [Candidatus Liberibacter sp.]MBA5724203.1 zinc ABC transporter substrate-binding protein [Candidatus Liberibacter sp.]